MCVLSQSNFKPKGAPPGRGWQDQQPQRLLVHGEKGEGPYLVGGKL